MQLLGKLRSDGFPTGWETRITKEQEVLPGPFVPPFLRQQVPRVLGLACNNCPSFFGEKF